MEKRVNKLFWVWDHEKERAFLEDMAKQGYRLKNVRFGSYDFIESTSEERIYQFDFKGLDKMPEEEYLQLYEDSGWDLDAKFGGWYYFSKAVTEDEIDLSIFNDTASKKAKYKRLLIYLMIVGFPLYYQVFFMIPYMALDELTFPSFYFFFRIVIYIVAGLHIAAVLKIVSMYRKLDDHMKE